MAGADVARTAGQEDRDGAEGNAASMAVAREVGEVGGVEPVAGAENDGVAAMGEDDRQRLAVERFDAKDRHGRDRSVRRRCAG